MVAVGDQLLSLAGQEHGRTIPLAEIARRAAVRCISRGSVRGQHDTRRHTATSMLMIFAAAAAGPAARFSYEVLAKAWC